MVLITVTNNYYQNNERPEATRMATSPNSCGNSSARTARETDRPLRIKSTGGKFIGQYSKRDGQTTERIKDEYECGMNNAEGTCIIRERCPDGDSIDEIVETVAEQNHPRNWNHTILSFHEELERILFELRAVAWLRAEPDRTDLERYLITPIPNRAHMLITVTNARPTTQTE
uniref:Uncharacterized protein n=1 Tax=Pristionchus pacificus TaxID=54126 RepID=A0A2A6CG54_PRIPA|eukprot:PDM77067.1 hypothetical protein PRIPAC_42462 [Pristionchus pacificus]